MTEEYRKDIIGMDQWAELSSESGHEPTDRVWCPLNSFNIPSQDTMPNSLLCLQGAGDIFMCTSFLPYLSRPIVLVYDKFRNIVDDHPNVSTVYTKSLGNPHDYDFCRLRSEFDYTVEHPFAARLIWPEAVAAGWGHYDWKRLMLGLPWIPVDPPRIYPLLSDRESMLKKLGGMDLACCTALHLTSSSPYRNVPTQWILEIPKALPTTQFLLLGGRELVNIPDTGNMMNLGGRLSYKETYELLGRVRAVVAVDSVVLHMAVAAGKADVLGLYGYTPPTWCGPVSDKLETVYHQGMGNIEMGEVCNWIIP